MYYLSMKVISSSPYAPFNSKRTEIFFADNVFVRYIRTANKIPIEATAIDKPIAK